MFARSTALRFLPSFLLASTLLAAQTPPPAAAPSAQTRVGGTVETISGPALTLKADNGTEYSLQVQPNARLLQIAPGSHDLSAAQPFQLSDVVPGDRILVNGTALDAPTSLRVLRIILMKQAAISDLHASELADWQRRGSGGVVKSVDAAARTINIKSGGKSITIVLQRTTILRRYTPGSIAFESALPGTFDQVQPGDQLRVRGNRSDDGLTLTADEIVSGSFRNVAGPITTLDAATGTLTIKDLTTKGLIVVRTTASTSLKKLDPRAAALFAAHAAGAAKPVAPGAAKPPAAAAENPVAAHPHFDLAQAIQRMPAVALTDLHVGDAIMVVASSADQTSPIVTAITVLGGVEPILSATPKGGQVMRLAPWSLGGGEPDAGGGN